MTRSWSAEDAPAKPDRQVNSAPVLDRGQGLSLAAAIAEDEKTTNNGPSRKTPVITHSRISSDS